MLPAFGQIEELFVRVVQILICHFPQLPQHQPCLIESHATDEAVICLVRSTLEALLFASRVFQNPNWRQQRSHTLIVPR